MKINEYILKFSNEENSILRAFYDTRKNKIKNDQQDFSKLIEKFLTSTMDEVRLRHSVDFAAMTLEICNISDASIFRQIVLQRELFRKISFEKQRDHTAHTVNNWLLGWVLFEKSPMLKKEIVQAIKNRKFSGDRKDNEVFGDLWMNVSLLHDIGYIFEGSIDIKSILHNSEYLDFSLNHIHDYFHHRIWKDIKIDPPHLKEILISLTEVTLPNFTGLKSLSSIGDALRFLGNMHSLNSSLSLSLSSDSFSIWRKYFEEYSSSNVPIILKMEETFDVYLNKGIDKLGIKVLDHGICGGLLQLQYSTFYFQIMSKIGTLKYDDLNADQKIVYNQCMAEQNEGGKADPEYWWKSVVWSTCAAGIHNLVQQTETKYEISNDPLAYLGILVDTIQCWDRFSVSPTSVFTGALPVQSSEVSINADGEVIEFIFDCEKSQVTKIIKDLNSCLVDWDKYILVRQK